ncbi:MAG: hypothetical protein GY844_35535, partial [Bradyrhizobium sp.]|nr:hypothetical protein [Bradyrhizobium sp.]
EQRIGRVQRLASDHAYVSIYNVTLRGTFEDYIVGRLMEKLQMAAHAVGDVEALLQGADVGDGDDDAGTSFEDQILKLVLAALAGKDTVKATRLAEKSIEDAKIELEREEKNIGEMLGSMDGAEYAGPRTPNLPKTHRSLDSRSFTLSAFELVGAKLTPSYDDLVLAEEAGRREYIRFNEQSSPTIRSALYAPGTPPFQRLVTRIVASGVHDVEDVDLEPRRKSEEIVSAWTSGFGASSSSVDIDEVSRAFEGTAVVRVRATVAHDSYERLVSVPCKSNDHHFSAGNTGLAPLPRTIEKPEILGVDTARLKDAAIVDEAIAEFTRFYLERRAIETEKTSDERKRRKLQDEFTPNLDITLVGAQGRLHRELKVRARYSFDGTDEYESIVTVNPSDQAIICPPAFGLCSKSGKTIPKSCLSKCEITGADVLRHLLTKSEVSGRLALPEFAVRCAKSNKLVLRDEAEISDVTGELVLSTLLQTSALSGKKAEAEHFDICAFTQANLLKDELAVSDISGKRYRADQQVRSIVSGRAGHKQEFVTCHETRQPLVVDETEKCEVTGYAVRTGVLERCEISGKNVLPVGLERCSVSGKKALKRFLVSSSVSNTRLLEELAVRSAANLFCAASEAIKCSWSDRKSHPNDIWRCELTGLPVHFLYVTPATPHRLLPLVEMLNGIRRSSDKAEHWNRVADLLGIATKGGKHTVEAAILSPNGQRLAICSELRTMLGLRNHHVGALYDLASDSIVGRISKGKRGKQSWIETST